MTSCKTRNFGPFVIVGSIGRSFRRVPLDFGPIPSTDFRGFNGESRARLCVERFKMFTVK